ncbi:MAG: hypothetical protein LQ351_000952 [Letrouitia transgressa]|nr:MAG: hypothetical protein LQ351_000952 [Letrouitia transgressa]
MPPHPKASNPTRRVSSSLSKVSTPPNSIRGSKSSRPTKIITLKLSAKALSRFPHDQPQAQPSSAPKQTGKRASTSANNTSHKKDEAKSAEVKHEKGSPPPPPSSSETPQPSANDSASSKAAAKSGSPKTGSKRGLGAGVEGPKPRARPGPKKKIRLDDNGGPAKGTSANAPAPTHKLGPKANQGAINAGLRALDRTGTPCRKWQKKGFLLKTFTGVCWELPSWRAPPKNLDSSGDSYKGSQATSNSQSKDTNSSSNVGSENSPAPVTSMLKEGIASSPTAGLSISA